MKIDSYFSDFLSDIRLTSSQNEALKSAHKTLRSQLNEDKDLKTIIVSTFLQGSYRRATAVQPQNGKKVDVDVILVTNLDSNGLTPQQAINKFIPFVKKHYNEKYEPQGRSICIELPEVDMDVVITAAPSEADITVLKSRSVTSDLMLEDFTTKYEWRLSKGWSEPGLQSGNIYLPESVRNEPEWKTSPLLIPDRDVKEWFPTHPLEQIRWTRDKNKNTNGHYVNVVKALKWWRTLRLTNLKYPKGYPIEHMIGDCCPDNITSVAEGVCKTMEAIIAKYQLQQLLGTTPVLPDRGVPTHNVWKRVSPDDFAEFYESVKEYSKIAREAFDADKLKTQVTKWRELFGEKFPPYDGDEEEESKSRNLTAPLGGFTPRRESSDVTPKRFA